MGNYTRAQKIKAVQREVALREVVFPRRVAEKKMSRETMDYEIGVMKELLADLMREESAAND